MTLLHGILPAALATTVVIAGVLLTRAPARAADELTDAKSRQSYALGVDIANNLKKLPEHNLDAKQVAQGLQDALSGGATKLSAQEVETLVAEFGQQMAAKQADAQASAGKANQDAGKAFLAANAKKDGVVTTASGLQYKVLHEGQGDSPKATDQVTVNYRGTLIDGTEFDSSYKRGQPATFPLNGVIKGWTEGLQLMKPGAKYQFVIPPELAYGARNAGPIQPNSTLVFEVELIKVGH